MAPSSAIAAEIKVEGTFRVGDNPDGNKFKLLIRNGGDEEIKLFPYTFKLVAETGSSQAALVENSTAAEQITVVRDKNIEVKPYSPTERKDRYIWQIRSANPKAVLKKTEPIEIGFSKVKSRTAPGIATLTFESSVGEENKTQPLTLEKIADEPGIIYFYSTTKERSTSIWPADERILEREPVILKWGVNKLENLTLQQGDQSPFKVKLPEGQEEITDITSKTDFVLSGKTGQNQFRAKVTVDVLRTGWYSLAKTIKREEPDEREESEPVLLFSANNQRTYGVLRLPSTGEGLLFQAENPFWGWTSMGGTVLPQYVGSPGIYADDKLWFVGGSAIDPDKSSNQVASFDPQSRTWIVMKSEKIPWQPRMGHAVLEFDGKIWVMGGCDQNGNALKDVWIMAPQKDPEMNKWIRSQDLPWTARCMFTCARFGNEIWAYGGFSAPFSGEFLADLCIYNGAEWKQNNNLTKRLPLSKTTIAACLQSFRKSLHIVGKISDPVIAPFHRQLVDPETGEWEEFPTEGLQGWGEDRNLSYQMVNYNDKFLIAKALGYEKRNTSLKIYVPERSGRSLKKAL